MKKYSMPKQDTLQLASGRVMKLSDSKHKLTSFVIMTIFPFYKNMFFNFQADFVLMKMGLYWPNFGLVFLIHLFIYGGVYCISLPQILLEENPPGQTKARSVIWRPLLG